MCVAMTNTDRAWWRQSWWWTMKLRSCRDPAMTDTSRRQRLVLIEMERANAIRMLSLVNHETMKAHARDALRDLDEAERWLGHKDIDNRPDILAIADAAMHLAVLRTAFVGKALKDYGPDAMDTLAPHRAITTT